MVESSILEHPAFGEFEEGLKKEILSVAMLRKFPQDSVLMDVNQVITHVPLVVSGAVKVFTQNDEGDELLLYYLEPGDSCAMTLKCCSGNSQSQIVAISDMETSMLFIPAEKIDGWMEKYSSWRNFILTIYSERFQELIDAVDGLAFNDLENRLVKYLKNRVLVTKSPVLHIKHHEIASDLNTSRVVISRLMKKLEKQKLIEQERNSVKFMEFTSDVT